MKWIKDLKHFEEVVADAKRRKIQLKYEYDDHAVIFIFSESEDDETTVEFDYSWYITDAMKAILSEKYNLTEVL